MEWVHADVHAARRALGAAPSTSSTRGSALGWLPDLTSWAEVVRALLKPGGVLYLVELHPMWVALIQDGTTLCQDALGAAYTCWDEPDRRSYADPKPLLSNVSSFERLHAISEVLTAVLDVGLTIELFHEFEVTPAPTPWLELGPDRLYHFLRAGFVSRSRTRCVRSAAPDPASPVSRPERWRSSPSVRPTRTRALAWPRRWPADRRPRRSATTGRAT